jgi:hypothetical protein
MNGAGTKNKVENMSRAGPLELTCRDDGAAWGFLGCAQTQKAPESNVAGMVRQESDGLTLRKTWVTKHWPHYQARLRKNKPGHSLLAAMVPVCKTHAH